MTRARLFFSIVGFGALTLGSGFADEASRQAAEPAHSSKLAANNHPAPRAQGSKADDQRAQMAEATIKAGMMNATGVRRGQVAGQSAGGGSGVPLTAPISGRRNAVASIGGVTAPSAKNSAAVINGTGMSRKR
jgi:hypothetical protein